MGIVSGAVQTREIVELATDLGWTKIALFPQPALHVGVSALITLTAAAHLIRALETNGIDNVFNNQYMPKLVKIRNTSCLLMATGATLIGPSASYASRIFGTTDL